MRWTHLQAWIASLLLFLIATASMPADAKAEAFDPRAFSAAFSVEASDSLFEDGVRVTWSETPPEGYIFHVRRDGALLSFVASTESMYYDLSGVPGIDYDYCVEVRDIETGGVLISDCDLGSRIIFSPEQVNATDGDWADEVRINWIDRSLIESGYEVYRRQAGAGPFDAIASLGANVDHFEDDSAEQGVVYEYCVAAVDAAGNESTTGCDLGERGFILPPLAFSASDGQYVDRVVLSWTDGTEEEDELRVYRDGIQIATLPPNTTVYEDFDALGAAHDYCVTTARTISEPPSTVESIQSCDSGIGGSETLAATSSVTASDSEFDDKVTIVWEDAGPTADSYAVLRDGIEIAEVRDGGTSFEDVDAVPGATHDYCVIARNDSGGASAALCDNGTRAHVLAPTDVSATDGNFETHVEISWSSASTSVVLFEILRDGVGIKTLSAVARSYQDREIDSGVDHNYCVRAYTALGQVSASTCDLGRREILPPESVVASDEGLEDRVLITWTDASRVEDGYKVFRAEVGGGGDPVEIATRGRNRTSYLDETGTPGLEYSYSVIAFDSLGVSAAAADVGRRDLVPPASVDATDGTFEDRIQVTWDDGSFSEAGFVIYRDGLEVGTTGANETSFTDSGVTFGAVHDYTVAAFDLYGQSEAGGDAGSTAIVAPGSFHASDNYRDRVVLVWTDESNIETEYQIYRDDILIDTTPADVTNYIDTGAVLGSTHRYCVTSASGLAISAPSCHDGIRTIPSGDAVALGNFLTESPEMDFGCDVDVDGDRAVVGDYGLAGGPAGGSGAANVFERNSTTGAWERVAQLFPPTLSTSFGWSVAIDGDWILVGAANDPEAADFTWGSVFAYRWTGTSWAFDQEFRSSNTGPGKRFGYSVDLDGNTAIIGNDPDAPVAIQDAAIFEYDGANWVERASLRTLFPSGGIDRFGASVALDGDRAAVSDWRGEGAAISSGVVHTFVRADGVWQYEGDAMASDGYPGQFFSRSLDVRGDRLLVGSHDNEYGTLAGAVYAFRFAGGAWREEAKIVPEGLGPNDIFGANVALGDHEAIIGSAVAGPGQVGAVYAYIHDGEGHWDQRFEFVPEGGGAVGAWYAAQVAYDGQTAMIGSVSQGRVYPIDLVLAAPTPVVASDALADNPVHIDWVDRSNREAEYRVYRDGELIQTLGPNYQAFNDFDSRPGEIYEYCVTAYSGAALIEESFPRCDFGRRPPDGSIAGRVETRFGAGVDSVSICLEAENNHSLVFDGSGGLAYIERAFLPPEALTMEFWMRSVNDTRDGTPVSFASDLEPNAFAISNDRNLEIRVNGVSTGATGISGNDGAWHHYAVTWRNTDGRVQLLKDGTIAFETNGIATGSSLPHDGTLVFGQEQGFRDGGFDPFHAFLGQLDEVRVWDRVLTAEEIDQKRTQSFFDDEDRSHLAARWTFDQGLGEVAEDVGPNAFYGKLMGGVHWASGVEGLRLCTENDFEGNFAISGVRYASSRPIKVTPKRDGHVFEPAYKTILLSTMNPVENEIRFTDLTQFSVSGLVRYAGTACFTEGVEILVDGTLAGVTAPDGTFAVSMDPGEHTIEARLGTHTFHPPMQTLTVDRNLTGIEFEDTTRRLLSGQVGGGCDLPIGTVQLAIENECFDEVIVETNHDYQLELAPGRYFIRVVDLIDPPALLDRADILAYFEDLGPQEVDLGSGDVRQDFTYRAPLVVEVLGLPEIVCPTINDPGRGTSVPGVPVLQQFQQTPLIVRVFEDYGNGNHCLLDTGTVTVFDEIMDVEDNPVVLNIAHGVIEYQTIPNTPNVFVGRVDAEGNDRSFQKPITFVVEIDGREPVPHTEWVLVTGDRPRAGTFVSATTEEIPLMILRDPPGDGSYSSVGRGRTTTFSYSNIFTESLSLGFTKQIKAGVQMETGGLFWAVDAEAWAAAEYGLELGIEAMESGGFQTSISTLETLSTSSDELFVGENADVYLGMALNLIFAKTDVLGIDPVTCDIQRSESVRMGGGDGSSATTYLYTRDHIQNVIIPQLTELATLEPAQAAFYNSSIANWQKQLSLGDLLRDLAEDPESRSFSAGADRQFTRTDTKSESLSWSVKAFASSNASIGYGFELAGSGVEAAYAIGLNFDYTREQSADTETTFAVDYTLSDNDLGDYFAVDVAFDLRYGTPVFRPKSGRSSCPWEAKTQPRDSVMVAIEPPVLHDVDPEEPGVFTLSLTNASPSEEGREYVLLPIQTTNPGGAILKANGNSLGSGLSFFIGPDQTQEVTLTVERGPSRYFYEDIQLQLVSPCEYERWQAGGPLLLADTLSFSIDYAAPCSDITLFEPRSGWTFNGDDATATADTVHLTLDDFVLQLSELDEIEKVGAQYRRVNTDVWYPIGEVEKAAIPTFPNGDPKSVQLAWDVSGLNDGPFELRAFSQCAGGKAFSLKSTGMVDRIAPQPFGSPQPADDVLAYGDEISITFDEPISCSSVNQVNVKLEYADTDSTTAPIVVDLDCNGTEVIITPLAPPLATLEGQTLTARITGLKDLAGNLMVSSTGGDTESWSFEVSQSAVAWSDSDVIHRGAFRAPGVFTAELVNGLGDDVEFTLTDVPEWLTPSQFSGNLFSTDAVELAFVISDTLGLGSHEATLHAVITSPPAVLPLDVRIELDCRPPNWSVQPESFQNSMTLVVQASIGGSISQDSSDVVVAFVGTELRGVGRPTYDPALDDWMTFLTVYSNRVAGENIRFRVFDSSECLVYGATDRAFRFEADSRVGEPSAPKVLVALEELPMADQLIDLDEGWTWFSLNLHNLDMSVISVLGDLNPKPGDLIKSQTQFSQFDPDLGWIGSLDQIDNLQSYVIKLSEAGTLIVEGEPVVPADTPIPVADGWNWVGYPLQSEIDVETALAALVPTSGDQMLMRSQDGFSQHVEGTGTWSGSLRTLVPGQGYRLYLDNAFASDNKLQYPDNPAPLMPPFARNSGVGTGQTGADGEASLELDTTSTGSGWEFDARRYEHTMTITGALDVDGDSSDGYEVGAFVNGELRGTARLQTVGGLEDPLFFLMVHGADPEGERVEFRVYDPQTLQVLETAEGLEFTADETVGTAGSPFILGLPQDGAPDGPLTPPLAFSLTPRFANPLRAYAPATFAYALPTSERVSLKVYDVQGRVVETLIDREQPAGRYEIAFDPARLESGVYFYRLHAGEFSQVSKLVLVK